MKLNKWLSAVESDRLSSFCCKSETQRGCSNTRDEARDTWGSVHRHADGDFRDIHVEMEMYVINSTM